MTTKEVLKRLDIFEKQFNKLKEEHEELKDDVWRYRWRILRLEEAK